MNQTKKGPNRQQFEFERSAWPLWTKKPFILYKFDDLQSRISKLKSVENFNKEFKRDSVKIKR